MGVEEQKRLSGELGIRIFAGYRIRKAAGEGNVKVLRRLLEANPGAVNGGKLGRTPLTHAIRMNQQGCVAALLENGAEVNEYDGEGWLPVSCAAIGGNVTIMEMLVQRGADLEKNLVHKKMRPLHLAIRKGDEAMVKCLITCGADVHSIGRGDMNPLHFAAMQGKVGIAKLIVEAGNRGADNYAIGYVTPLDLAKKNTEMSAFLAANCEINAETYELKRAHMVSWQLQSSEAGNLVQV